MKTETRFIDAARSTRLEARELPAEKDPGIDQNETYAQEKKTQDWIARGGSGPQAT
jgi:hypothetical protein